MNEKKRHTILDLQVMNKFVKFNHEFNKWMNEVCSRNVRNTIGRDIRQLLHDARCELVNALGLEVSLFPVEKYHCFNKAQCLLYSVQLDLNDLNDDGTLSNDGKARLDMLLDDVLIDIHRLLDYSMKRIDLHAVSVELQMFLSSLINQDVAGRVPQVTAKGETCDLEGCITDCDKEL